MPPALGAPPLRAEGIIFWLAVELGAGAGFAVGEVETADDDGAHSRLDIAAVQVLRIARQRTMVI